MMYITGRGVEQDWKKAQEHFLVSAKDGNKYAQCFAGLLCFMGLDGNSDYTKADYWLDKSTSQDFGGAYYVLGILYATGAGSNPDFTEAARYFEIASTYDDYNSILEIESPKIKTFLANLYLNGIGVQKDTDKAVNLLQKALIVEMPMPLLH